MVRVAGRTGHPHPVTRYFWVIVNFFSGAQYTRGAAASLLIAVLIVVLLVIFRRSLEIKDPYASGR